MEAVNKYITNMAAVADDYQIPGPSSGAQQ
jgi:hypothetical protein